MRKLCLLVALSFIAAISLSAQDPGPKQDPTPKIELPELHTIKSVTLSPSYSCRSADDFGRGYANTALFLSPYSKQRNSPDPLFNGACKSEDYFEASTAGDDMALIADLGNVDLEEVSASRAFNFKRVHSWPEFSKFVRATKVKLDHTYAVLLNKSDLRGLFIFKVVSYVPNQSVELKYAVKSYQIFDYGRRVASAEFSWDRGNQQPKENNQQ